MIFIGFNMDTESNQLTGTPEAMDEELPSTSANQSSSDLVDHIKAVMLDRIANSDAHFKHQQRGDPDLTHEDKLKIASDILNKNPVTFLERFGSFLTEEDLVHFTPLSGQYEVEFYLKEIRKQLDNGKNKQKIRNRRYEAMKKLMLDTDYFEDEEMKSRNPLLYDQLVGQFLTGEQIKTQSDKYSSMSSIFMQHLQGMKNSMLYDQLKDREDGQMEESDEESDEEEENEIEAIDEDGTEDDSKEPEISSSERQLLRTEFVRAMQLRFLNGEDDFDYSKVDNNAAYDSLDIEGRDEEEKYFDGEEEEAMDEAMTGKEQPDDNTSQSEVDYETFVVTEDVRPGLSEETKTKQTEEDLITKCDKQLDLSDTTSELSDISETSDTNSKT